jgi:hypothetical protein
MSSGEKAAESFTRTRGNLAEARERIDATLMAMNGVRMTDPSNLRNAFGQYKTAVKDLEQQSEKAKQLALSLQQNVDANMAKWQKEMETVQDPSIRSSVESRRDAVRSNYSTIQTYAQDARKAFDPFLRENKEIVQALSVDLSPAAVSGLSATMDRAAADGKAVKQKISALERAMDNIAKGVGPSGQTP